MKTVMHDAKSDDMLGMKNKKGRTLKNPLTLLANDRRVVELFAEMQCVHVANQREPCEISFPYEVFGFSDC